MILKNSDTDFCYKGKEYSKVPDGVHENTYSNGGNGELYIWVKEANTEIHQTGQWMLANREVEKTQRH
jgi:hypothetical protein